MGYKFNPLIGAGFDESISVSALDVKGTVADVASLPGGATTGDVYKVTADENFYVWDGAAWVSLGTLLGPQGPIGPTGSTGADGQTVLNGTVDPTDNVTGTDGDFYINTTTNEIFGPRTAGAWGSGTSLVGPGGGATTLGALNDVDLATSPPTNGEALVYDSANSEWVPGAAGATAAGAANQIQYNDGASGLAASADLTWDNTGKELGVGGDLNLDSGGTFSTTIQSVTPTANRTISFPDQTGTVGLVSGATGNIQFNDAGKLAGSGDFNIDLDWNNASTVFTGLKVNVTDTASAAGSKLLDLQVGGTPRASFSQQGVGGDVHGELALNGPSNTRIRLGAVGTNSLGITLTDAGEYYRFGPGTGFFVYASAAIGWANGGFTSTGIYDLTLYRDAANTLAQRNGTNAQTYRLYNTYTDASNYERGFLQWDTNVLKIGTENAGTGTARDLKIQTGGTDRVTLGGGNGLTISGTVSQVFVDCTTYFASATAAASRALAGNGFKVGSSYKYEFSSTSGANGTPDAALARDSAGVVAITDGSTGTGYVKQTPVLVSALPAAATVGAGTRGFVSDATATTFASVVTGSGTASTAGTVPVYSDGTDWRIG